ncbi:MAG TPA: hypothetical protein VMZ03_14345 [Chitinophagaceae bacterium]|nr:hypothetical protein [Chitinophagaceae bacterium]
MKKSNLVLILVVFSISMAGCGSKKESAASVAQDWCDLNGKAYKAEGAAKENAEAARKKFEEKMVDKYGKDKAFMDEIGKEVEKCEDASEGR